MDLDEKTVLEHEEGYFTITVPIVNENYNMLSNLTVTYNEKFDRVQYVETHFQESENGFFKVLHYLNGRLLAETETEYEFIDNEEFEEQFQELEMVLNNPRARSVSCTLNHLVIGIVVAGLLTAACLPICIATVGQGCAVCFGTFVAATPVVINNIVRCWR